MHILTYDNNLLFNIYILPKLMNQIVTYSIFLNNVVEIIKI